MVCLSELWRNQKKGREGGRPREMQRKRRGCETIHPTLVILAYTFPKKKVELKSGKGKAIETQTEGKRGIGGEGNGRVLT